MWAKKRMERAGVQLHTQPEDDRTRREGTVDFVSFSYYSSRCITAVSYTHLLCGKGSVHRTDGVGVRLDGGAVVGEQAVHLILQDVYKRQVHSYFALRKWSCAPDEKGVLRFCLNDKPILLNGCLLYTSRCV